LNGADIVVLIVTHEDFLRDTIDSLGIERKRLWFVGHGFSSRLRRGLRERRIFHQRCGRRAGREQSRSLNEVTSFDYFVHFRPPLSVVASHRSDSISSAG